MGKIHFLSVGCGDTSIIQTDTNTYLIDCYNINNYSYLLPNSKKIKALFVTHQHYDHFMGMEYLLDNNYHVDYLIFSPYERRYADNSVQYQEWQDFKSFVERFEKKGTKIYKPYRQDDFNEPWWKNDGLSFYMLGPAHSIADKDTRELHDASLVFHVKMGNRRCLFTGDASDTSLEWIAENTKNICNDILHASHHGSINGANLTFIKKANAKHTIISTKSGVHSSVPDSTALQRYRQYTSNKVHRTDTDGDYTVTF